MTTTTTTPTADTADTVRVHFVYRSFLNETVAGSFDAVDERRRVVGWRATVQPVTVELHDPNAPYAEWTGGSKMKRETFEATQANNGTGFWVRVQQTRNGEDFGALTRETFAVTLDEAVAEVSRKLDGMRKRYAKKYGGRFPAPVLSFPGLETLTTEGGAQ